MNPFTNRNDVITINLNSLGWKHSMHLTIFFILKLGMEIYTAYFDLHQSPELSQYVTCQKEQFKAIIKIDYDYTTTLFKISIFDLEEYTITDFKHLYLQTLSMSNNYIS